MISWGGISDGLIQKYILKVWLKHFFFHIYVIQDLTCIVTLATRRQGGVLHMDSKRDRMSKNGYCQGNRCHNYNAANKHQVLNILHMSSSGELQSLCPKHPSVEPHCLISNFNLSVYEIYRNKTYLLLFPFSRMKCSHQLQHRRCCSWLLDRNWPSCLKLMVKHRKHTEYMCEYHHMCYCHHDQTHSRTKPDTQASPLPSPPNISKPDISIGGRG